MKEEEIIAIVEDKFTIINKLTHKILEEFNADDLLDFRIELKKLRAFLRLLDVEKEMNKPLIPKLLKTFYGYVGIIRNILLHRHDLFKYITDNKIEQPGAYIQIIDNERRYWEKQAVDLMTDNSFKDNEDEILKQLPDKLERPAIKRFVEKKLDELKEQLKDVKDDDEIHAVRKILKDILFTWNFINHDDLPKVISQEEDLKQLITQRGYFRDRCIQLEFLQLEYLNKIKDENEKARLSGIKDKYELEKEYMKRQIQIVLLNLLNKYK